MILFCACAYSDVIPEARKAAVLAGLPADANVRVVPDLCALAARRDPLLAEIAEDPDLVIVACRPRAIRALFEFAGAPLGPHVRFTDLRNAALDGPAPEPRPELPPVDRANDWVPWFPVIDRERCHACRQCLEFCLFGVYEQDDSGGVRVVHPERCKTNCPACARICPDAAIIFPKYAHPHIDGSEITDEEAVRAASKAVAEGDLRAVIEERNKRRRALLKPEFRDDAGGSGR